MWQSAATDMTLGELWQGSLLHEYGLYAGDAIGVQGVQYFVWGFLFLIFLSLVFRTQAGIFFSWVGIFLTSPAKRTYFDTSAAVRFGLPLSSLIAIPAVSFIAYGTAAVEAPYLLVLGCTAGYFLVRFLIFRGIAYVSGNTELVTALSRMTFLSFAIATAVFCMILLIGMFLPGAYPFLMDRILPGVSAVLVLLYFIELVRIFFAFKEPLLLSILYLCTLEILPIVTAVVTILKY